MQMRTSEGFDGNKQKKQELLTMIIQSGDHSRSV